MIVLLTSLILTFICPSSTLETFSKLINERSIFRGYRRKQGAHSSRDGRREAGAARLPHCCWWSIRFRWGHVSQASRCSRPRAEMARVSRWGGQFRLARSNSADLCAPVRIPIHVLSNHNLDEGEDGAPV